MKKTLLALLAVLATSQAGFAVLPPLHQGMIEIKTILNDPKLQQSLGSGEVIVDILKTEHGYLIVTNKHRLPVEVIYQPAQRPGPAQFELKFGDAGTVLQ